MHELLLQAWWMLALRGVIALLFGVLALIWPGLTLLWLVALFAAYALLVGVVSVIGAVRNRQSDEGWWLILLLGLVSIGAAVSAIVYPGLTALVLVLVMGANALITGVLDIATAIRLRAAWPMGSCRGARECYSATPKVQPQTLCLGQMNLAQTLRFP